MSKPIIQQRILFELGDSGRDEYLLQLQEELQKKVEHEPFFHAGPAGFDLAIKKFPKESAITLEYEKQTKIKKPDIKFLQEAEKKHGFNIWDTWEISAQRKKSRRKIDPETILIWYEYIIKEFSHFVDKHRITDYIFYGPASFASVVIMKILEEKKINLIELQASPLRKRFGIANSSTADWPLLARNYKRLKKEKIKDNIPELQQYLDVYHNKDYVLDWTTTYQESAVSKYKRYVQLFLRIMKYNHYLPSIRPLFWKVIQKWYDHRGLFEEPVPDEKFVLFPLHFQPEATTLIYGKWYNNQLNLIECLVRAIPVGYKLYVKEHSYGYGNRHLQFYKDIKKFQNVRLITPHVKSLDLIKQTSLVVTITGTVGWESLMLQKPVLIFGNVFYDIFDGAKKVRDISELPSLVRKLLDVSIPHEETLRCLKAVVESTYPGLARLPSDSNAYSLQKENMELLAAGIAKYLEERDTLDLDKAALEKGTKASQKEKKTPD